MSQSYAEASWQSRPFICTPYVLCSDGRFCAKIPDRCPILARSPCRATDCDLRVEYYRARKTGPPHALAVIRCRRHGEAFTLYPPGYAPYRRQPVMQLSHDGSGICCEQGCDAQRADFDGTLFESALDARDGLAWSRKSGEAPLDAPERYWGGQGRHLRLAARLTGVARDLSERMRESIAMILSVDGLDLREGTRAVGYRGIGKAVCSVLAKLKGQAQRTRALLICGAVVGSWGEPLYWDAKRRVLERTPFRLRGMVSTS